ncbi:GNAT family N-acetyltransferase [Cellulomonas fengjieae]|uniref:GNAT family N-acetyltransferase n=1 Tax=Cellulomonas fengjieae TaxID=2819978 RepID=A0ABS3SDH6_9CELL|nr:GNAT family N-acetyltransferase [Cellulomonas fengjieae]MBO3083015.1 GNAT family N-acetyltransferase [Cellulomonas fengjieae]QVI65614.1 GNAT family N-acetyltransferase [Cellulomonas fengjieae]
MLETPTVSLRPLTVDDAGAIASWARDEEFCRAAEWPVGRGLEFYSSFYRRSISEPPADLLRLGVVHGGHLIGYVDLHGDEPDRRELGYLIGERRLWGKGVGTVAAAAGLEYGFADIGLREIWAEALDANEPSVRILRRLGMRETGNGNGGTYLGEHTHYRQFVITADEFNIASV